MEEKNKEIEITKLPLTQIRDVKILEKGGYKAEKCMPFDLFPYTEHIENICVLKRGK